jgi:hypothetical protein
MGLLRNPGIRHYGLPLNKSAGTTKPCSGYFTRLDLASDFAPLIFWNITIVSLVHEDDRNIYHANGHGEYLISLENTITGQAKCYIPTFLLTSFEPVPSTTLHHTKM